MSVPKMFWFMIRLVTIFECCRAMLPAPIVMAVCNEALSTGLLMLELVTCTRLGLYTLRSILICLTGSAYAACISSNHTT